MKKHTLIIAKINKDIFELISSGKKKVETRAYTDKYNEIKAGDTLMFSCDGEHYEANVKKATHFKTIKGVFKVYTPEDIHPGIGSEEGLIEKWHSFPNYKEKIAKDGLLAFELE